MSVKKFIDDFVYRIDLDADYQRENIWSTEQREALLDSIMKGIDIPKMYLAEISGGGQFDYECVDGKQRMQTLLNFYKPDTGDKKPLRVELASQYYTQGQLLSEHPDFARRIDEYLLDFVVYKKEFLEENDSNFVKLIFRRLQLGMRLVAGEILHAHHGPVKDFVFGEIGKTGPFVRNTGLSEKRFSREFALAQICLNSFAYEKEGSYSRARLTDVEDFFETEHGNLRERLSRIKSVLTKMDEAFGVDARNISSRAVAVSAYLFSERLFLSGKGEAIVEFAKFYVKLLDTIKDNSKLLRGYKNPTNTRVMEEFQKYLAQASAEASSIKRRDDFLREAFDYYQAKRTHGKIIGF